MREDRGKHRQEVAFSLCRASISIVRHAQPTVGGAVMPDIETKSTRTGNIRGQAGGEEGGTVPS